MRPVGRSSDAGAASIRSLLTLADSHLPGPSPSFTGTHILLAFMTIEQSSYVSRKQLATRTGVGEGAARTILKKLKERKYVGVIRSGCFLTRAGNNLAALLASSMSRIVAVPSSKLTVGDHQVALVLRGAGPRVGSGIEQRDSAIRVGASGATTYVFQSGKFTIPGGSSNCEKDFPSPAWSVLRRELVPRSDDVVMLCGGQGDVSARLGVLAAVATLV